MAFFWDSFSSRGFFFPSLLNTDTSEVDLKDIEFPLTIKICAEPGFNETAIKEAGYKKTSYYFKGISRFNSSLVGWAGHTEDFGVKGSVEEVHEKVRSHKVEDVIQEIVIDFNRDDRLYLPLKQTNLPRVNYPHNCYTLDLSSVPGIQNKSIKTLGFLFKSKNVEKVQMSLHGNTLATNREIFDNSFHAKGDLIIVTPGRKHKYGVEISKNEYLEEDKSKRCRKYPNSEYASYMACDDQFVRDICEKEKLAPIWLLDDISQATVQALIKGTSGKYVFFIYLNLYVWGGRVVVVVVVVVVI